MGKIQTKKSHYFVKMVIENKELPVIPLVRRQEEGSRKRMIKRSLAKNSTAVWDFTTAIGRKHDCEK